MGDGSTTYGLAVWRSYVQYTILTFSLVQTVRKRRFVCWRLFLVTGKQNDDCSTVVEFFLAKWDQTKTRCDRPGDDDT